MLIIGPGGVIFIARDQTAMLATDKVTEGGRGEPRQSSEFNNGCADDTRVTMGRIRASLSPFENNNNARKVSRLFKWVTCLRLMRKYIGEAEGLYNVN